MIPHPPRPHRSRLPAGLPQKEIIRILRFGLVGGVGTLLNTLIVWLLLSFGYSWLSLNPGGHRAATGAALFAWIICCGINYLLNAAWTFQVWPPSWKLLRQYYLTAALTFIFQLLLLNFLLFLLETNRPIETAALNAVAVATGALLNYLFASLWVFRQKAGATHQ